ncbi:Methionyl-tRNA formyltransferase [subsurface metagenome]
MTCAFLHFLEKMKIVYFGSGEFGIECLNALAESSHSLAFVVTQPPQPAGRGRKARPTPVARWADASSMPYMESDNVNAPSDIEIIAENQPDLIVVVAFGQKIGDELINLPPKGAINVHASLLPKYRGAAPINWVIVNGERQTGISIITLVEKMDAGDILAQQECEIGPDETAGQLHDRLAQMAAPLLLKTVDKIEDGSVVYTRQDHSKATLAPRLKKSDAFLDFGELAESLRIKILGFWPWPGASAAYVPQKTKKSQQVIIAEAKVVQSPDKAGQAAGTLDEDLNIICGRDALKITRIKPAGGSLMDFRDFVNGRQSQPGDMFVKIEK